MFLQFYHFVFTPIYTHVFRHLIHICTHFICLLSGCGKCQQSRLLGVLTGFLRTRSNSSLWAKLSVCPCTCVPLILYSPLPQPSPHLWAGHSLDSSGVRARKELSSSPQSCSLLHCLGTWTEGTDFLHSQWSMFNPPCVHSSLFCPSGAEHLLLAMCL